MVRATVWASSVRITLPGTPTTSEHGGITERFFTSAPAATIDPAPITAPFITVACMPTVTSSSMVAPCTMALWPTDTRSPSVTGQS